MSKIYKLKFQFTLLLLLSAMLSNAQTVAIYNFSQSGGSFTPLVGATIMGNSSNDDDTFGPFSIGFNFNYHNTIFTTFSVNTNGYIVLGTTTGSSTAVLSDATSNTGGSINNAIAGLNEDLIGQNGSVLWYQLQGSTTNHILVVEWKNYNMYGTDGFGSAVPGVGDALNFQIQLFQTSNKIEVVYGSMQADSLAYFNPEVGLRGNSNADFNNRKVNMVNTWASSVAGTMNTDLCLLNHSLFPMSGVTYIWTRTSVGIESNQVIAGSFFDVYPNPSSGTLKISIPSTHIDNCIISIIDMEGKTVFTCKDTNIIGNYSKTISTQGIAKGMYYMKLDTGNGADIKKIVIQ